VKPVMISQEDKEKDYRKIYEVLWDEPRVFKNNLAEILGLNRRTALKRFNRAIKEGYVLMPQIRKRSYANLKEHVYFVKCNYPFGLYMKLSEDNNVVYHAQINGFANLWVRSKEKINFEKFNYDIEIIFEGDSSDVYVPFAPNHSWDKALIIMDEMVANFDHRKYRPKEILKIRWNETLDWWDEKFEILYGEFKYDLRSKYTPIETEHSIWPLYIKEFLDKVEEACTVFTGFFPKGVEVYDPYLFMFETDYEDFIIELFSQLPTFSFFFKVPNRLFAYLYLKKDSIRKSGLNMSDVNKLQIRLLIHNLFGKGILKSEKHAIVEFRCRKDL
jgi:hypothetical protein